MKKFFLMSAVGSGLEKLENTAVGIMEDIQLLLWVAVALALLVNGLFLIIGGEEGRAKAKKAFPWVVAGCVFVAGAFYLAKYFVGRMQF